MGAGPILKISKRRKAMMDFFHNEDVYIPERKLTFDEQLREDNPGLKELWDQYQTMRKLVMPAEKIDPAHGDEGDFNPNSNRIKRPPKKKRIC